MAITFVGADTTGGNVADTSTLAGAARLIWPTVEPDDVAWIFWTFSSARTPTTPSGFTLVADNDGGAGTMTAAVYRKVCAGTEDGVVLATVNDSANRQTADLLVLRGVNTTTPENAVSVDTSHTTGTTHNNPAVTPTAAGCGIVVAVHERATSIDADWTSPSGYTEAADSLTLATGSGGTITAVAYDLTSTFPPDTPVTAPVWTGDHATGTGNIVTYAMAVNAAASDATVTPSTVAAVAAVPSVTASAGSTVTAATVAAVASIPAAAVSVGSNLAAAAVAASAAVPSPAVSVGSTLAPGSVAAVASVPSASVSTGSTVTPATVAAVAAVPDPVVSAGGNANITPATVSATTSCPSPDVSTGSTAAPATVAAVAAVASAAISTGSTVAPSTVAAVAGAASPGLSTGAGVSAGTVTAVAAVNAATVVVAARPSPRRDGARPGVRPRDSTRGTPGNRRRRR